MMIVTAKMMWILLTFSSACEEDDADDDVDDVDVDVDDAETASVKKHVSSVTSWKWPFSVVGVWIFPITLIWDIFEKSTLNTSAAVCTFLFFH